MYSFRKAAGLSVMIAAIAFSAGNAWARYQFDDLIGNGRHTQWMIISGTGNSAGDTFGDGYVTAIDVSGDLVSTNDALLHVMNGESTTAIADRNIHTVFLVLEEGQGEFQVNIGSPQREGEAVGGDVSIGTYQTETQTPYTNSKNSGTLDRTTKPYYNALWNNYKFTLARRTNQNTYGTDIMGIYFRQLPSGSASNAIIRPLVISNVHNGPASQAVPLIVRMTLRDAQNGNIIAYNRDTWAMNGNKSTERSQWVFVPVEDLDIGNSQINFPLTTEVANHTGLRYAARFYDSAGGSNAPDYWKFDVFRRQGTVNIERSFFLDVQSNIAPGLAAVYNRPCNINEQNIVPLSLFAVDTTTYPGDYSLTLNHKVVYGKLLGQKYTESAQTGGFNMFEITAFKPNPASTTFYQNVARVMQSTGTVSTPDTPIFTSGSVKKNAIAADVTHYFTVNQNIPSGMRGTNEGMLPLHITFNIPVTQIRDSEWLNNFMQEWRNTGVLEDIFSNKYELYLKVTQNGHDNIWNMTSELKEKGHYNDIVKVFFDPDRGASTQDNDTGLITVSFMVMLMNGTRGNDERPALQIVTDNSIAQENNYMVLRDGVDDSSWNMTFFVAPAGWSVNNVSSDTSSNSQSVGGNTSGSSGGGCSAYQGITLALMSTGLLFIFTKNGRR